VGFFVLAPAFGRLEAPVSRGDRRPVVRGHDLEEEPSAGHRSRDPRSYRPHGRDFGAFLPGAAGAAA